jgi:hypothetical protein
LCNGKGRGRRNWGQTHMSGIWGGGKAPPGERGKWWGTHEIGGS